MYKRLCSGWTSEQAVNVSEPPPRFRNFQGHAREQHWKTVQTINGRCLPGAGAGEYKLYVIRNARSDMEYVGITINDLKTRLRGHFALAAKGRRSHFYNALRLYGPSVFSIKLVRSDASNFAEL